MSKHTPGPWRLRNGRVLSRGNAKWDIHGGFGAPCAWEPVGSYESWPGHTTGEANARLIAAAPELLEALGEYCAEWATQHEREDHRTGLTPLPESLLMARQAIAKATRD